MGRPDVVVVGGGILGLFVALRLSEERCDVRLFASPARDPRSDSQRNQSWLQSGLLYPDNIEVARRLFRSGTDMHDHFGKSRPTERGIFRFASQDKVEEFLDHAAAISLRSQVKLLDDMQARARLGCLYQDNAIHFEVPDGPFDEASLMQLARDQARTLGAQFHQQQVSIVADASAPRGYSLVVHKERLFPSFTVVCSGAGTPKLLAALQIQHPLIVNQSNLLVIDDAFDVAAPLLADRFTGLTAVRWSKYAVPPAGCLEPISQMLE